MPILRNGSTALPVILLNLMTIKRLKRSLFFCTKMKGGLGIFSVFIIATIFLLTIPIKAKSNILSDVIFCELIWKQCTISGSLNWYAKHFEFIPKFGKSAVYAGLTILSHKESSRLHLATFSLNYKQYLYYILSCILIYHRLNYRAFQAQKISWYYR